MHFLDVTISIVLYKTDPNEVQQLLNCIDKIKLNYKAFIVDNSPTKALQNLISQYSNTEYIFNDKNLGYGSGHNVAMQKALSISKYHIVLNPDITFNKGTIEALFNFAEQNPNIGHVMPKILYENGEVQRLCKLLPHPLHLIARRFFVKTGWGKKIHSQFEIENFKYDQILNVPSLSGCFMFLRCEVLKKVGIFDPQYFMYLEDFDLTRRIYSISRTVFYPKAQAIHRFDKASYTNKKMFWIHIISAIKYFNKWGWFFDSERNKFNNETLNQLYKTKLL